MQTPVLEIEDLNISFFVRAGEIPAVMDFSCKVMPGETMGLVGESGCGKSTVALGIMRDMGNRGKIVGGSIKFQGRDMGEMSEEELRDIRGSKIAMIYQEPMASLNPAMKIGRQLMEVPIIHEEVSEEEAYSRSLAMLESVKLPDPARVMEAYPHQISGGQQQRIVIAMALLSKPDLLLLDEPTTALDVTVEAGIVQLIKELGRTTGTSMLFISHNLGLILETCDRITVMYSGEAVETGSVHEVFDRMRHPYTQGLFNSIPLPGADKNSRPLIAIPGQLPLPMDRPRGCNFGPRCDHYVESVCNAHEIRMQPIPNEDRHFSRCARISEIDWNAEPERNVVEAPVEPGKVVLEMKSVKKYYDVAANKIFGGGDTRTVKANEEITFNAREAETVAIVGESGCGKSTLAKVLLGLETATEGEVLLDGKNIGDSEVQSRSKRTVAAVQMVFQNPFDTLNPSHTVGSQIMRTLEKFGIGDNATARRDRMLELLDLVKLPRAFAERMPRQLSGGQKQRIGVARAFAGQPRVVVADEPVSALDVSVQAAVTELLMEIQREARTTMLFISHDLSIVRYIADRVVVMYLGHIVEQGTTDDIFSPPYHPYTEALLSAIPIADTSVQKKHIVLDGDIPSAMNPPSGCPFQTRCPRKAQVPGDLCEREVPPQREVAEGHFVKCHLNEDVFAAMEPVIVLGGENPSKSTPKTSTKRKKITMSKSTEVPAAKASGLPTGGAAALGGLSAAGAVAAKTSAPRRRPAAKSATKAKIKSGDVPLSDARARAEAKAKAKPSAAKTRTATKAKDNSPARIRKPAKPDDLKLISGVGPKIEGILNSLGVYTFAQIGAWKKAEREWVDDYLSFKGRIDRDNWVGQAKKLAKQSVKQATKKK
ncbi:dipeptide ABC transporter ATP-binding protein [Pseudahrensia aquimaris]|uniref:Dipeptide ABC transporter ATP-binding protein n=1 Tax=Pseudahrensia aquimaris TaxID=744461 RepID=A0ABW3FJH8_9HYPH